MVQRYKTGLVSVMTGKYAASHPGRHPVREAGRLVSAPHMSHTNHMASHVIIKILLDR